MTSWNKGKKMFSDEDVFCKDSKINQTTLREYYAKSAEYRCADCGIDEWQGKKIGLELHHVDGDHKNNLRENLKYLCPNCHSFTVNFKGKGIMQGHTKASEEDIIEAVKNSNNISETLIRLDLVPRGGNYTRIYKIMAKNHLSFKVNPCRSVGGECMDCGTPIYYDAKRCQKCLALYYRKVVRPTKEELEKMISEMTWEAIGKKYGVCSASIKKWARQYGIVFEPRKKVSS